MSRYIQMIAQRRRLMMLVLAHKMGNTVNVDVMHLALTGVVPCTLDDLRADMLWLNSEGLASMIDFGAASDHVQAMELTRRGAEVAIGSNTHPGVARLMPGDLEAV
jgi:hypothetical protein